MADCKIDECVGKEWDAIACPGGMPGAEHLRDSAPLTELLKAQVAANKVTAAVCASPAVVFATHGLLPAKATCFPVDKFKAVVPGWEDAKAVVDGSVHALLVAAVALCRAVPSRCPLGRQPLAR